MNTLKNSIPKAVNRFFGYIHLRACRADTIRLLNMLRNKNVSFWGFRATDKEVFFKISLFGCERVFAYARDANIELTIVRRVGLPFFTHRYRGRVGLAVGALIAMAMIFSSIFFVWNIEVTGNYSVSDERILSVLKKNGLFDGAYIPGLSTHAIEERTILTLPELSSVAIAINGTYVTCDVIERERPPKAEDEIGDGISSIYATTDGIIVSVVAESGKVMVHPGDVVAAGDMLVSGIYDGFTGMKIAVRSKATVTAKTYKNFAVSIPLEQYRKSFTGRKVKRTMVKILGQPFELYFGAMIPYDRFTAETNTEKLKLFGFIKTPVEVTTLTAYEYTGERVTITKEEAEKQAIAAFNLHVDELESGELLEKSYSCFYDEAAGCVTLTGRLVILENIAVERPIQISESP